MLGRPFSPIYGTLMKVRELLYRKKIFSSARFDAPVISVGNLTLGGTGKTPVVQYLARLLQKNDLQPAIVSRGYGGATKERVNVVSDGNSVLLDAQFVGDEPRFLAETLPGIMVYTGVVRKLPAQAALENGADVLVLDDGFQHMAIQRDLDLVLFQADTLAGNSRIFPGGDLREPVSALHRCDAFVMTGVKADNRDRVDKFQNLLRERFPGKPVFFMQYKIAGYTQLSGNGQLKKTQHGPNLQDKGLAFCAIANPNSFQQSIQEQDLNIVDFHVFRDHHSYGQKERNFLLQKLKESDARYLLTTEKDMVKLQNMQWPVALFALCMEIPSLGDFDAFVLDRLGV